MADPKGINPTPHANPGSELPSPNISTRRKDDDKDDDQENTTSLNMNTVADLKKIGISSAPDAGVTFPQTFGPGKWIPQNLIHGAQKAVRELNLPGRSADGTSLSAAEIFGSAHPDINPEREKFNIPGYKGDWALSVDKKYIGTGLGQVSAERWANVAKHLGQFKPSASPAARL
ncbi:MAG TPA: hypothetical protein VIJ79_00225 [Acidobacteriaceae bacterium]